jgi:hypothetical protein
MMLEIPISTRSRRFGYIFWAKSQDESVKQFFGHRTVAEVWFEKSHLGQKRIDWKNRRISMGWSRTRRLPREATFYRLTLQRDSTVKVTCT